MRKTIILILSIISIYGCSSEKAVEPEPNPTEVASISEQSDNDPTVAQEYINNFENKVTWSGTMMGMYTHTGTVDVTHDLQVLNGKITGGTFTVDLATMSPTDKHYDESKNQTPEKLVEHLSSPDFFDVKQFPTATFVINSVSKDESILIGDMTIRGVTIEENVKIKGDKSGERYKAIVLIDRTKYGLNWSHPMKEMVLSDEIKLLINIRL